MSLLGIDPGGTTGLCLWTSFDDTYYIEEIETPIYDLDAIRLFRKRIRQHVDRARALPMIYDVLTMGLTIILEPFEFRRDERHRDKIDYTPAELNGVMKGLYVEEYDKNAFVDLKLQSSSQVMEFWTEDKLRRLGLYKTGKPHGMDALRHVLHYRTFKLKDPSLLRKLR